jgi:hypothetical protein
MKKPEYRILCRHLCRFLEEAGEIPHLFGSHHPLFADEEMAF